MTTWTCTSARRPLRIRYRADVTWRPRHRPSNPEGYELVTSTGPLSSTWFDPMDLMEMLILGPCSRGTTSSWLGGDTGGQLCAVTALRDGS
eukprot:s578_g6.t1